MSQFSSARVKPPYPSPPSYNSHPCYNGLIRRPQPRETRICNTSDLVQDYLRDVANGYPHEHGHSYAVEEDHEAGQVNYDQDSEVVNGYPLENGGGHHGYPGDAVNDHEDGRDIQFYDWDAVNMNTRQHRPDLSSDSDYFSTSTTYKAENYKGESELLLLPSHHNVWNIISSTTYPYFHTFSAF